MLIYLLLHFKLNKKGRPLASCKLSTGYHLGNKYVESSKQRFERLSKIFAKSYITSMFWWENDWKNVLAL